MRKLALIAAAVMAATAIAAPAQAAPAEPSVSVPAPPRTSPTDKTLTAPAKILKKAPPTSSGVSARTPGVTYYYAGALQSSVSSIVPAVTTVGANVQHLPNPLYKAPADSHTLVELAVRKTNNSNCGLIEAGITVDPVVNPDSQPRLFVFAWDKNCAGVGYNTGFVLSASRTISPGDVVSTTSAMSWSYVSGNWWLAYQGAWVGYYPNSVFGTSFTFDRVGQFLGFGEVANAGVSAFSCSDMGDGVLPSATTGKQISSVSFNSSGTNVNMTPVTTATGYGYYQISARSFKYGGPGTNSVGGLPGTTGSC